MAELSERSGVPVPTIKYYLREGLVPAGVATGATRASYDESHVRRLRLVRALVAVGGLGLDRVRDVLRAIDDDAADLHEVLSTAHEQLSPVPSSPPSRPSRDEVAALVRSRRWRVNADGRHSQALAAALDALAAAGQPVDEAALAGYADAAEAVARQELAGVSGVEPAEDAATYAITGTVLAEPVLLALRRLAHENLSTRRFARR